MALSIKNQDTHKLVKELASLTGKSMTEAVTKAVRERLERLRRNRDAAGSVSAANWKKLRSAPQGTCPIR
jgi:antitoxin VapB